MARHYWSIDQLLQGKPAAPVSGKPSSTDALIAGSIAA
jgi:hypothetical protein